jgi:excisionase family DNA binding protein
MSSTLSVRDLCERYGVGEHTILHWVQNGSIKAINVGRRAGAKKPRWRFTQEALAAFEASRTPIRPLSPTNRKKKTNEGVIKFY